MPSIPVFGSTTSLGAELRLAQSFNLRSKRRHLLGIRRLGGGYRFCREDSLQCRLVGSRGPDRATKKNLAEDADQTPYPWSEATLPDLRSLSTKCAAASLSRSDAVRSTEPTFPHRHSLLSAPRRSRQGPTSVTLNLCGHIKCSCCDGIARRVAFDATLGIANQKDSTRILVVIMTRL